MAIPISYILADDDEIYREYTSAQLKLIPELECLAVCENAFKTRDQLMQLKPDLLILDIEMPGLTGIELASSLPQLPMTIFITSHKNYAVEAFELDAIDYLVKPVPMARMLRAIDKVKHLKELKTNNIPGENFGLQDEHSFFVKEKNVYQKILYTDVLFAESLGDFITLHLQNGEKKVVLVTLKNLIQQLPASVFVRISRTHIINLQKLTAMDNEMVQLGAIQLYIGKTYYETIAGLILGNKAIKRFL